MLAFVNLKQLHKILSAYPLEEFLDSYQCPWKIFEIPRFHAITTNERVAKSLSRIKLNHDTNLELTTLSRLQLFSMSLNKSLLAFRASGARGLHIIFPDFDLELIAPRMHDALKLIELMFPPKSILDEIKAEVNEY